MKIRREEKLVTNLKIEKGYVVHIKALDQALKHGLKLKKVHRVIEFRQSKWMKAYIMLNTRLRKDSNNEFAKDFFKLMNNNVFGKTMENIRNHNNMKLVTSDNKYLKHVMKPNFKGGHPFSKHLFAVEMGKTEITTLCKLCYMDIDSFLYETETKDFYRILQEMWRENLIRVDIQRMITGHYPIGKNQKVIGLVKDELGGIIMTEFVVLRAKMYAYRKIDFLTAQHEHFVACDEKRCKGTKKCVVFEDLTFDDYKTCLFDGKTCTKRKCCLRIRSMRFMRLISIR